MMDLCFSDTPYVNIIISAYSISNIMSEAIPSSQNYCTCSRVAPGKQAGIL